MEPTDFECLFKPTSVAVAGAGSNPESMGARTLNMIGRYGFTGPLYAINPSGKNCGEWPGFSSVRDLPVVPDLCIVAAPPRAAVQVVRDCAERGVPFVQVLTSQPDGSVGMDQELVDAAQGLTRIVGPNCVGTHSPAGNITFVEGADRAAGSIAIISQSGGLSLDFVNQAAARGIALRAAISVGNCADVSIAELIDHFVSDDECSVIGIYLEGIADGGVLLEAIGKATQNKPVVILKGGRSEAGSRSAASHTGAIAIPQTTWSAAMRQFGVIEAATPDDFLAKLSVLDHEVPGLLGPHLAVLGNGGGMTVLATDALADGGLSLATLSEKTQHSIRQLDTPPGATLGNPADIPAGALTVSGTDTLAKLLGYVLDDANVNGAIVHFNLVALLNYPDPRGLAKSLAALLSNSIGVDKPIYAALRSTPDPECEQLRTLVLEACQQVGIPCLSSAIEAAETAVAALSWTKWRAASAPPRRSAGSTRQAHSRSMFDTEAEDEIKAALARGETALRTTSAVCLLEQYGVECARTRLVTSAAELATAFAEFSGPIAMKVEAEGLTHKTDVNGVHLGVSTLEEAESSFHTLQALATEQVGADHVKGVVLQEMVGGPNTEVLVGMYRDRVLGKVIVVGLGGIFVELLGDTTSRLPPITADEAGTMLSELRGAGLLRGLRGSAPRDISALARLIANFSVLVDDCPPQVSAIDLNPVLVLEEGSGALAVDCRFLF